MKKSIQVVLCLCTIIGLAFTFKHIIDKSEEKVTKALKITIETQSEYDEIPFTICKNNFH